ncbi:hypothetical protein OsI_34093 [Oryza sativa Indica Group]|uniref:Uncharacterized protein n=1 Tax=Oryza sativa subsp. indica TaxID=39946 RepID=B8BHK5_ORYSI|nr:hypothetical protein OsI_34093 [Oryza sativa Indica Group]
MAAATLLALGNGAPDVAGVRCGTDGERRGDEHDGPDDERGDERASATGDTAAVTVATLEKGGGRRVERRSAGRRGRGEDSAVGSRPLARLPLLLCSASRTLACRRRRSAPPAAHSCSTPLRRPPRTHPPPRAIFIDLLRLIPAQAEAAPLRPAEDDVD